MGKHTQEPWIAKQLLNHNEWVVLWFAKNGQHMRRLDCDGKFSEEDAKLIAATHDLLRLANRVALLNADAGEIGPGMLAQLVNDAKATIAKVGGE